MATAPNIISPRTFASAAGPLYWTKRDITFNIENIRESLTFLFIYTNFCSDTPSQVKSLGDFPRLNKNFKFFVHFHHERFIIITHRNDGILKYLKLQLQICISYSYLEFNRRWEILFLVFLYLLFCPNTLIQLSKWKCLLASKISLQSLNLQ